MKSLQFELWEQCGSGCSFCYLGDQNKFTPDHIKLYSLRETLKSISDEKKYTEEKYEVISYLGGEFFQGQLKNPEVREEFFKLMKKTAELLDKGLIKAVWIYATMTIGNQQDLFDTIELFNKKDGLWILTSYDTIGRFHTQKMLETWDNTMKKIHSLYPEIRFNITTILTGDVCQKYVNGELSFKEMMNTYQCAFFFKQCGLPSIYKTKEEMNKAIPNFFPKREDFLNFLMKFRQEESEEMWAKLFNIYYRADTLYRNHNVDGKQMELNVRDKKKGYEFDPSSGNYVDDCGHMKSYKAYVDSEDCCICDKLIIEEMMEGSAK